MLWFVSTWVKQFMKERHFGQSCALGLCNFVLDGGIQSFLRGGFDD